jgi:hypothetical protein
VLHLLQPIDRPTAQIANEWFRPVRQLGMIFVLPAARRLFKRGKLFATPQVSFENFHDEARTMLLAGNLIDSGGDSLGKGGPLSGVRA